MCVVAGCDSLTTNIVNFVDGSNSRGQAEPDRQLLDHADAISAEGGSLLKRNPTRQDGPPLPRECNGLNGGPAEPDRCHPA
jgi:hypothetical protein